MPEILTTMKRVRRPTDLTRAVAAATPVMRAVAVLLADVPGRLTPTAAKREIRDMQANRRQGFVVTRNLDQAIDLATRIQAARKIPRRAGARPCYARADQADARAALAERLQIKIHQRRDNHVFKILHDAAMQVMRHGAPGGTRWDIAYTLPGEPARYDLQCERVFDVYRGAYKGWGANRDIHTIRVPRNWLTRVNRIASDGVAKGSLILDAECLIATADDTRAIYKVLVARNGRGYSAIVETRYASCWPHGVTTLHSTESAAIDETVPDEVSRQEHAAHQKEIQNALREANFDARDADAFASL
jgi:hypothetical protein